MHIKSKSDFHFKYLPSLFRHAIVSCQDEEKIRQKYAMAKVLRTLQVQTESFLMILIQTHILCHKFQPDREETWAQICLTLISILNLSKDCAEHHFHEISGKSLIPFRSQLFTSLMANLHLLNEEILLMVVLLYSHSINKLKNRYKPYPHEVSS